MKKTAILLLVGALFLVSCGKSETSKGDAKADTTASQKVQDNGQADLSKETADYKKFVEEQIDMLLKDTENFAQLLKAGKLDEAKKAYPLILMAYERSEPIAESFGESDIKIDKKSLKLKKDGKVSIELKKYYGKKILQRVLKNMQMNS